MEKKIGRENKKIVFDDLKTGDLFLYESYACLKGEDNGGDSLWIDLESGEVLSMTELDDNEMLDKELTLITNAKIVW